MKKYSILVILAFLSFIGNVYADGETISGTIISGSPISNNVYMVSSSYHKTYACEHNSSPLGSGKYYCGRDANGSPSVGSGAKYFYHMQVEPYKIKLETGETYPAICIDPLVQAPTSVTCSKLGTSDAVSKMASILSSHASDSGSALVTTTLAIRNLAGQAGITHSSALSSAIASWEIAEGGGVMDAAKNYFAGNASSVASSAKSMVSSAAGGLSNDSDYVAGDYKFTFTQTSVSGTKTSKTYIYKVSVDKPVPNEVTFTCVRCTVTGKIAKGAKSGNITVKVTASSCPTTFTYTIKYKFKLKDGDAPAGGNGKTVYKCSAGSNKQSFVALLKGSPSNEYNGSKDFEFSCDDVKCDPPIQNTEKSINMCCDSGTTSSVHEPLINKLFCDTNKSDVKVIGNIAGPQANSDFREKDVNINEFCKTWCTERIIVEQPGGASVGRNGKYFTLNALPDSKGPKFTGYKTCRLVTDYKTWLGKYVTYTNNAVTNYNNYQSAKALADSLQESIDTMKTAGFKNKTVTGTASYSGNLSGSHCSATCSTTASTNCTFKYRYDIGTYSFKTYTYTKIKAKYDSASTVDKYNGVKIETNGTGTQTGSVDGYLDPEWTNGDNCDSAASKNCETSCTYTCQKTTIVSANSTTKSSTYNTTCTEDLSGSVSRTGVSKQFGKTKYTTASYQSMVNGKYSIANGHASNYGTNVGKIKELEDKLDKCNKWYTAYDGKNDSQYAISPTASFNYVKIYVDSSQNPPLVTHDEPGTDYKVTCHKDPAVVAGGGETDENGKSLGLNAQQFNEIGGVNHTANVYNFTAAAVNCNNNSPYQCGHSYTSNLSSRSYDQKYVTDAYYKAVCTSDTDTRDYYTLYPFGGVIDEATFLTTKHNTEYYVEYSALYGQFLTYWTLTGLGTKSKFDAFFAEGTMCSGDSVQSILKGSAGLSCKYKVESELSRISGCDQSSVISQLSYKNKCCHGNCTYIGEDELTYTFKIVDSAKIFPDDGVLNRPPYSYAYNWYQVNPGPAQMVEIEKRAKNGTDKVFDQKRVSYEFNLDVEDLTLIKKYNGYNSYNDFNLTCNCSPTNNPSESCTTHLYKCKSTFLSNVINKKLPGMSERLTGINKLVNSSSIHYSS